MSEATQAAEDYSPRRWGMVIDVNRCVGCQTCTVACKQANDTVPGVQWRKVIDIEFGSFPDVQRQFLVTGCQHCAEPSCVPVCPTGATFKRADGFVVMDYDLCIGCGYCAVACPYQARTIVKEKRWFYGTSTVQEAHAAHDERIGVAQKCTFCMDKVDDGLEAGLTPGPDPEATPACAASCIAQAIKFGDFNDPGSHVSELVAERASFGLHEDLGNQPQIKYLFETPAVPGRDAEPEDLDEEAMADPANPLVGPLQTLWDYRAAMNFTLGGMGTGLALAAYLAHLTGAITASTLNGFYAAAGAIMAVGLFFVFLEIARKLRFLYVILRPQSSWMTREVYVVAVFYPLVGAGFLWPGPAVHLATAVTALAFLYCQGRILHAGKGIPAWRVPRMPAMLVATGLLEGTGLYVLATALVPGAGLPMAVPAYGALLVFVNAGLWDAYRRNAAENGIGVLARRKIDGIFKPLMAMGYILPGVLWGAAISQPALAPEALALSGLAAVAGGVMWKFTVITRASHQQDIILPKLPQRGSGRLAAPVRLDVA